MDLITIVSEHLTISNAFILTTSLSVREVLLFPLHIWGTEAQREAKGLILQCFYMPKYLGGPVPQYPAHGGIFAESLFLQEVL